MKGSVTVIVVLVLIALMITLYFYPGGSTGILLALAVGAVFPVGLFFWYRRRNRLLLRDSALAGRMIGEHLRSMGEITKGPAPFGPADRSRFLQALDEAVHRAKRAKL